MEMEPNNMDRWYLRTHPSTTHCSILAPDAGSAIRIWRDRCRHHGSHFDRLYDAAIFDAREQDYSGNNRWRHVVMFGVAEQLTTLYPGGIILRGKDSRDEKHQDQDLRQPPALRQAVADREETGQPDSDG